LLARNFAKPTRFHFIKCGQDCWHSASQVWQSIAPGSNHKNRDWQRILVLLILHALVRSEQEIKLILCECEQLPVPYACPTLSLNSAAGVADQQLSELFRDGFVKQYAHLLRAPPWRLGELGLRQHG